MTFGPLARIVVRYGAGLAFGASAADAIMADPDVMHYVTMGLSLVATVVTEYAYRYAKKWGGAT